MYKNGEGYRPPHCFLGHPVTFEGDTIYHMGFTANIKGSDVFNGLGITFESDQPLSFSNLKAGDVFDYNQFHAAATFPLPNFVNTDVTAMSGKVSVVGTKKVNDKSYMVLRLIDLRFDKISDVYTVNGTVEYEMY